MSRDQAIALQPGDRVRLSQKPTTKPKYYVTSITMATTKKIQKITSVDEDVKKLELLGTVCGNVK